jgi:glyoxylase I family protein
MSFIFRGNQLGMVVKADTQPSTSLQPAEAAVRDGIAEGSEMERVTGIGGLFFQAHDPKALGGWYQQHLGISLAPSSYEDSVWQQEAGPTVFEPLPVTSELFGSAHKAWTVNFRVLDLDKMAVQLRTTGIKVEIDPQSYLNGRFAGLHDPEGNPIQLWQPKTPGAPL